MSTTARGFTIIEVMLFLAITGALTVGILIGAGASISQQRYRDSVNSFKSHIQEQYGQVTNVINSNTENPVCSRAGSSVVFDESAEQQRGTSKCLFLGRFLLIEPTKITAYDVIGRSETDTPAGTDVATLQNYALSVRSPESKEVAWSARIVRPGTADGITTSVLILRSPLSGSILTYTQDGDQHRSLSDMIATTNMAQKDFCIDSQGLSAMGNRFAVRITANANNQSSVEIPLESEGVCG